MTVTVVIATGPGGPELDYHVPNKKKERNKNVPYDPEKQYPVIRASICTGEKVAGFKDKAGGHFMEIMLIRTPEDLAEFKRLYGITDIKTEY